MLPSFGRVSLARGRLNDADGGRDDAELFRREEEPGRLELGAPEAAPRSRLSDSVRCAGGCLPGLGTRCPSDVHHRK